MDPEHGSQQDSAPTARRQRVPARRTPIKANQLWLGVGLAMAVVTVLSGIASWVFNFHDDSEIQREVFVNVPTPLKVGVLHHRSGAAGLGLAPAFVPGQELGAGRSRPAPDQPQEHQEAAGGLPVRHLHADPDAGTGRRHHALADLLQLHHPAGRDHGVGDQPPGPGEPQVPQRQRLQGLRPDRRPGRRSDSWHRHGHRHRPPVRARRSGARTGSPSSPGRSTP